MFCRLRPSRPSTHPLPLSRLAIAAARWPRITAGDAGLCAACIASATGFRGRTMTSILKS
jgi:predicted anti-sigma-YlaC factor YlaD